MTSKDYRFGFNLFTTRWTSFYLSIAFLSGPACIGVSFWRWHLSFGWVPKHDIKTWLDALTDEA